jgi:hypothetical protein
MSRRVCPELYPDPRPSRLLAPLLPHLPALLRAVPWLAAVPPAVALATLIVSALPLLTWLAMSLAVLLPLAAGAVLFTIGWDNESSA